MSDAVVIAILALIFTVTVVILVREELRTKVVRREAKERAAVLTLLSHQLRSPLSTVKIHSDLLKNGELGKLKVAQVESLNKVDRAVSKAFDVLHELVARSGIGADSIRMTVSDCDVSSSVQASVDALHSVIASKNQTVVIQDSFSVNVRQDPVLLHAVFEAVLENAVYYSPKSSKIFVTFKEQKDSVLVGVNDNGIGITKKESERIFEKFFRGEKAITLYDEGDGLGLYTSLQLMQSIHGDIRFTAGKKKKGSTFVIKIPKNS